MRVTEVNNVFKNLFKKNLHVQLELNKGNRFKKEFLEDYRKKYFGKEVPIVSLSGTDLDVNRWEFGDDLSIVLTSVPFFDQVNGKYVYNILVYADIEPKVKQYSAHTLLSLMPFVPADKREDYFDYVKAIKNHWGKR